MREASNRGRRRTVWVPSHCQPPDVPAGPTPRATLGHTATVNVPDCWVSTALKGSVHRSANSVDGMSLEIQVEQTAILEWRGLYTDG